jgi:hypothetical protein
MPLDVVDEIIRHGFSSGGQRNGINWVLALGPRRWMGWEALRALYEDVELHSADAAECYFSNGYDADTNWSWYRFSGRKPYVALRFTKNLRLSFDTSEDYSRPLPFHRYLPMLTDLISLTINYNEWAEDEIGSQMLFNLITEPTIMLPASLQTFRMISSSIGASKVSLILPL